MYLPGTKKLAKRWRGPLVRAVAIFFLLHAGADLLLPQYFCSEDCGEGLYADSGLTADRDQPTAGAVPATDGRQDTQDENSPEQVPHSDDCFCCGANLLVSSVYGRLELNELATISRADNPHSTPYPPVRDMFRPPRIG